MLEIPGVNNLMSSSIPFMLVAGSTPQVNRTRLIEAAITAVISGAVIALAGDFIAFPVLQEQVSQIRRDIARGEIEANRRSEVRAGHDLQQDNRIRQLEIDMARIRK